MKKPDKDELLELWLVKHHNITVEELIKKYPEEIKSANWFKLFPCTQEQSDDWEKEVKQLLNKKYKISKWMVDKGWWAIFLDCSPYVEHIKDKEK